MKMKADKIPDKIIACEPRNRFLAMEMDTLYTTVKQRTKILDRVEQQAKKEVFDRLICASFSHTGSNIVVTRKEFEKIKKEELNTSNTEKVGE